MTTKMAKLADLVGKKVTLTASDRYDSEYHGVLLQIDAIGAVIHYSEHGRDLTSFLPLTNIDSITHKHVDEVK